MLSFHMDASQNKVTTPYFGGANDAESVESGVPIFSRFCKHISRLIRAARWFALELGHGHRQATGLSYFTTPIRGVSRVSDKFASLLGKNKHLATPVSSRF